MVRCPLVGDDVGVMSEPIIRNKSRTFVLPCTEETNSLLEMKFEYL